MKDPWDIEGVLALQKDTPEWVALGELEKQTHVKQLSAMCRTSTVGCGHGPCLWTPDLGSMRVFFVKLEGGESLALSSGPEKAVSCILKKIQQLKYKKNKGLACSNAHQGIWASSWRML